MSNTKRIAYQAGPGTVRRAIFRRVATDMLPSGLIRYWLLWHYRHHRLHVPGFAAEIHVTPAAVHNWISGERGNRRGISEQYWPRIAAFFQFDTPEQFLGAARALYLKERVKEPRRAAS